MSYKNSSNTTLLIGEKKIKPDQSVPNPESEGQKFNKDLSRFIDLGLVEKEAEKKPEPKNQKVETTETPEKSKKTSSKSSKTSSKTSKTAAKEDSTESAAQQTESQESTVGVNQEGDQNDNPTNNQDSGFGL